MRGLFYVVSFLIFLRPAWAVPEIQHWQTSSGTEVYFIEAPELPMVDIGVVFDAGSTRDGKQWGIAEFTNGLLLEGSGKRDSDAISEYFENLGAQLSNSTSTDMSTVQLRSLTDDAIFNPALEGFAQVLAQPQFNEDAFQRLRQQVFVNLKLKAQSPHEIASAAFLKAVYQDHPYGHDASGTKETVGALTPAAVRTFYEKYYVSANAKITMIGAISRDKATEVAEFLSSKLPKGHAAPALVAVPKTPAPQTIHIEYPSAQTHVYIGQVGTDRYNADYLNLYVANMILGGGGLTSLLSQELREKRGLSYSTSSYFIPQKYNGYFVANVQTKNDQAALAIELINKEIRSYLEQGATDIMFDETKQGIMDKFPLRIKDNKSLLGYLMVIANHNLPLDYISTFNQRVDKIDKVMIKAALKRHLNPDHLITVTVGQTVTKK